MQAPPNDDAALPLALDLSDEALFRGTVEPQLTARLLDSRFVGIALRAPSRVDIDQREKLPLLVVSRFDGARDFDLPFGELALLTAIDLRTGQLKVKSAFGSDKTAMPTAREARPAPDALERFGAQLTPLEARSRLGIAWQPGCWAIRLIYHDWVSKPVHVLLERGRQPETAACPSPRSAETRIAFRWGRDATDGTTRVRGHFTLPIEAVGGHGTAVTVSLLVVAPGGASFSRADWRIPVAPVPGTRWIAGAIDQAWTGRMRPGALAYLVLAGELHGPQPWERAAVSAPP